MPRPTKPSAIERGISLPSFETLQRLSRGLGVPIKDFFEGEEIDGTARRAALLITLLDVVRSMPDDDLEIAVRQIEALASRGR